MQNPCSNSNWICSRCSKWYHSP